MAAKRLPSIRRKQRVRGLSLLELVLALALSVVVIGLVSMALRFQLQTFDQRRDRVEQAALGRAILRHISDDLRCAIANRPIDLQGVSMVTGNATQSLTGEASPSAGDSSSAAGLPASGSQQPGTNTTSGSSSQPAAGSPPAAGAPAAGAADAEETSTAEATSGAAAGQAAYVAGLYGDQHSVQFDMTRLPRLDEYSAIVSEFGDNPIAQIPTDIRTVSYYLSGSTPMTQASAAMARESGMMPLNDSLSEDASLAPEGQGLVRQERDRAVASYSEVSVDYSDMTSDTGEELLAEEVTRLEFQYFDGYEWWPSWDSDERGGLPVAIEIVVGLLDRKVSEEEEPVNLALDDTNSAPRELYYRLVVRIPTAEPLDPYAAEEETPAADPNAANADAANADTGSDPAANTNGAAPTGGSPMGGTPAAPPGGAMPGGFGPGGGAMGGIPGGGPGGGGRGGRGGGGGQRGGGGPGGGAGGPGGGGQRPGGGGPGGGFGGGRGGARGGGS